MGRIHLLSIIALLALWNAKAEDSLIKNFELTNLNYFFTARWDPLPRNVSSNSDTSPTLYTLLGSDNKTYGECVNITQTYCNVSFAFPGLPLRLSVLATVDGIEKTRTAAEDFFSYEIDCVLSKPIVQVEREDSNLTVMVDLLSPIAPDVKYKFNIKYSYFTNGTEQPGDEETTTNQQVSFITSAPAKARICVKANIEVDYYFPFPKSNWSEVCIQPQNRTEERGTESNLRYEILIATLVGSAVFLAILIVFICSRYCRNPFRQDDVELPKDTATVLAMSQCPGVAVHNEESQDAEENFSQIISGTDRFENLSLLNEHSVDYAINEKSSQPLKSPEEIHGAMEHGDGVQWMQSTSNNEVERPELPFSEDFIERHEDGNEDGGDCDSNAVSIHVEQPEEETTDLAVLDETSQRKLRLESADSAFCDSLRLSPALQKNSSVSERTGSETSHSHVSVDSCCSVDEGYVRVPLQDDENFA